MSVPNQSGPSHSQETFWGRSYTQHHNGSSKGNVRQDEPGATFWKQRSAEESGTLKAGLSEVKETLWGDEYALHYDAQGNNVGRSERTTDFWGRPRVVHYDESGLRIGEDKEGEAFFQEKYEQHKKRSEQGSDMWKYANIALGLGAVLVLLLALAAAWVTLPLWGGMLLISSGATFALAEGLRRKMDWALQIRHTYDSWSAWFGPVVAAACAIVAFAVILITGDAIAPSTWSAPSVYDGVVLVMVAAAAFWLSERIALPIFRWRVADQLEAESDDS